MHQLGSLEELVLLTVCILHDEAYGFAVLQEVHEQSGRSVTLGTIHKTLYRLEDKGLLSSHMGGATEDRGGRRKRLFTVTGAGLRAAREARDTRDRMWELISSLQSG